MNADVLEDNRKKFLIKQWKTKRELIKGTGKYRNYMHWRHDRLSNRDLINAYVKSLSSISAHSFFAAWNFHQYLVCKNNIEKGQILIVHDYAQNYLCKHQDEIQALHLLHAQVTIHPSSVSYRCPIDGCNTVVLHEIVHITDDLKHDTHLVKKFQAENLKILRKRGV